MSLLLGLLAAAASKAALPPRDWNCTALDDAQTPHSFSLVTDTNGDPVAVTAKDGPLTGVAVIGLEQLKHPTDNRLRVRSAAGQFLVRLTEPSAGPETRIVNVDADLGDRWPHEQRLLRGVCRGGAALNSIPAVTVSQAKDGYFLLFVRIVDGHTKGVEAHWAADCAIVDDNLSVSRVPVSLTMSDRKIKIELTGPVNGILPAGVTVLDKNGFSQQSLKTYNGKADRVFNAVSSAEQRTSSDPLSVSHSMSDIGGKIGQQIAIYRGNGKQIRLMGAGTCRPIAASDLVGGLRL